MSVITLSKRPFRFFSQPLRRGGRCASVALAALLSACSNIDCPLDNVVHMQCNLYDADTEKPLDLAQELTVTPAGRDTVLLNRASAIRSFLLPLKESGRSDTLLLRFADASGLATVDTLFVEHEPKPHFESLDCPASVFHIITQARASNDSQTLTPLTVDSVSVVRKQVNYDDIENLRLFLRTPAVR